MSQMDGQERPDTYQLATRGSATRGSATLHSSTGSNTSHLYRLSWNWGLWGSSTLPGGVEVTVGIGKTKAHVSSINLSWGYFSSPSKSRSHCFLLPAGVQVSCMQPLARHFLWMGKAYVCLWQRSRNAFCRPRWWNHVHPALFHSALMGRRAWETRAGRFKSPDPGLGSSREHSSQCTRGHVHGLSKTAEQSPPRFLQLYLLPFFFPLLW